MHAVRKLKLTKAQKEEIKSTNYVKIHKFPPFVWSIDLSDTKYNGNHENFPHFLNSDLKKKVG